MGGTESTSHCAGSSLDLLISNFVKIKIYHWASCLLPLSLLSTNCEIRSTKGVFGANDFGGGLEQRVQGEEPILK